MKIDSARFGTFEIEEDLVISFPQPIAGFPGSRRYVLLAQSADHNLAWLHSADEPDVAFPVVLPGMFFTDYIVDLDDPTQALLQAESADDILVLTLVSIQPGQAAQATANLLAPIVINQGRRIGVQALNRRPAGLAEPLFAAPPNDVPALGERADIVLV